VITWYAASFADGDIGAEQLSTITRRLRSRLVDLERQQAVVVAALEGCSSGSGRPSVACADPTSGASWAWSQLPAVPPEWLAVPRPD